MRLMSVNSFTIDLLKATAFAIFIYNVKNGLGFDNSFNYILWVVVISLFIVDWVILKIREYLWERAFDRKLESEEPYNKRFKNRKEELEYDSAFDKWCLGEDWFSKARMDIWNQRHGDKLKLSEGVKWYTTTSERTKLYDEYLKSQEAK